MAFTVLGAGIVVRVAGPGQQSQVVIVTTNQTKLPGPYWGGRDGGGHSEMTFQLATGLVVVTEHTWAASKGISSEIVHTTRIPTNKTPFTFTVSQSTVTVMHAKQALPENQSKERRK